MTNSRRILRVLTFKGNLRKCLTVKLLPQVRGIPRYVLRDMSATDSGRDGPERWQRLRGVLWRLLLRQRRVAARLLHGRRHRLQVAVPRRVLPLQQVGRARLKWEAQDHLLGLRLRQGQGTQLGKTRREIFLLASSCTFLHWYTLNVLG